MGTCQEDAGVTLKGFPVVKSVTSNKIMLVMDHNPDRKIRTHESMRI